MQSQENNMLDFTEAQAKKEATLLTEKMLCNFGLKNATKVVKMMSRKMKVEKDRRKKLDEKTKGSKAFGKV